MIALAGEITLSSVLTDITTVMTSLFAGVSSVVDMVMANPVLFISIVIPIIGAVIGFTRRLLNL